MAILSLNFNNKNQYRKFPLKQSVTSCADNGYVLADNFIVNCRVTSVYGKHRIYIKQIHRKETTVRITIASYFDDVALGVFSGDITEDFTTLYLTPFTRKVSGNLTIGSSTFIKSLPDILSFEKDSSELEESVIFCYVAPAVSSIQDQAGNSLRGAVKFGNLTNLTKVTIKANSETLLSAAYPESVKNPADLSTYLGNCPTPVIKNINGVVPYSPGNSPAITDGNIYIAGVKPIIFYGIPGTDEGDMLPGFVGTLTEGMDINSLCSQKRKLLPPVDLTGVTSKAENFKSMHYSKPAFYTSQTSPEYPHTIPARLAGNFNITKAPEYYFWPQFVKEEYYTKYWHLPNT